MKITTTATISPSPRVGLAVAQMPASTVALNVQRLAGSDDALDAFLVRGASAALVGTTASVMDLDAPTGVDITYTVTAVDATGAVVDQTSVTVPAGQMPDPGGSWGWLSDPLDADSPLRVRMLVGTDDQRSWQMEASFAAVQGDRYQRARVSQRKAAPVRLVLCVRGDEMGAVEDLLRSTPSLLFRPPSHLGLPATVFGVAPEITATPFTEWREKGAEPHWHFDLTLTPTRGPGRDVLVGGWTYGDVVPLGTYRQLGPAFGGAAGTYPTYRELLRGV